jgi:hypothetical protein
VRAPVVDEEAIARACLQGQEEALRAVAAILGCRADILGAETVWKRVLRLRDQAYRAVRATREDPAAFRAYRRHLAGLLIPLLSEDEAVRLAEEEDGPRRTIG